MKVLHIITRLEKGGSAKNTLASLSVDGFDNFLVYGPCAFSEKIENSSKTFEASHLAREISPYKDLRALIEIYFLIKKIEPDIIHTHTSKAGILGRMAAFIYNFPFKKALVIHTPHGHLFYGYYGHIKTSFFKIIERIFSKITDFYIALTEGEKIESIESGLGDQKKWIVINSGIDFPQKLLSRHEARSRLGLPEKVFIAAYVGRLEYVKGPDIFIEIASLLNKYEDAPSLYVIVGDGSMRKELEKLAIKKSIFNKILFLGHREDVFEILRAPDFIIQPSRNEAMGRTVIEAQYCGLPVVASDACGLPWAMIDGKTGFLFKRNDVLDAVEKVKKLFDPLLREKLSQEAYLFAREKNLYGEYKWSSSSMRRDLYSFYLSIIKRAY